jgi:hypothetical protein
MRRKQYLLELQDRSTNGRESGKLCMVQFGGQIQIQVPEEDGLK